jgi:hypothetical protein
MLPTCRSFAVLSDLDSRPNFQVDSVPAIDLAHTVGSKVVIFQRTQRATVAVLWENQVIGSIDGDAARDLQNMFDSEPSLRRTLKAEIIGIDRASGRAELSVAER